MMRAVEVVRSDLDSGCINNFFPNGLDRVMRVKGGKILAGEIGKLNLPFTEMRKMGGEDSGGKMRNLVLVYRV